MIQLNRDTKIILLCVLFAVCVLAGIQASGSKSANNAGSSGLANNGVGAPSDAARLLRDNQRPNINSLTANLPLSFEENGGQLDPRALFVSRAAGLNVFLTATGAVMDLQNKTVGERNKQEQGGEATVKLLFRRSNPKARATGVDQLRERRNYLIGNDPRKWRTDVPTFRAVHYDEIYPGISLTYYGNQQQLEYDLIVAAGADPRLIRLSFDSGGALQISTEGDLLLATKIGEVRQHKPIIYQELEGRRQSIEGRYVLLGRHQVGFEIGAYDRTKKLVIDPTLVYSTYLGGGGDDLGSSIAVDSNNNVYVAGSTSSVNFPVDGAAFGANAGLADIFVSKIDASGSNVIYSTYIGGSGIDRGDGIAIDSAGNAYVVGRVDSSSINFPTTPGSFGATYRGGDFDGVVFKLNSQGNGLVYSAFLGGEENDSTEGVVVDATGIAYVTGGTKSSAFPTTGNAYQGSRGGDTDAFLTKINAAGSSLLYSTYLGGSGTDRGSGVVVDNNGNAFVAGFAGSPDFPTENAFQNNFGGGFDAFVAEFDTKVSGFTSLVLCSYLGGQGDDKAYGIALDSSAGNLLVVGQTSSSNFPVLNAVQPASGGGFDAFVAKISVAGTKVYATYLGGSGDDRGTGVAVNAAGAVYVTGFTSSTNFPTVTPLQSSKAGGSDAFISKINAAGSGLLYSTYLGGSNNESSISTVTATNPVALDSAGNAYLTGYTASNNFPATPGALQGTNAGGASDAFVTKISDAAPAADFSLSAAPPSQTVNPGDSTTYTIMVTPVGGFTGNVLLSASGQSSDTSVLFNPSSINITDSASRTSVLTVTTTAATPAGNYPLTIGGSSGNLQHSAGVSLIVPGAANANLSVTKTASPNPATVGASLTYRIILTNNGPSPATNATITDSLVAGPAFVSAIPSQGSCSGTTTVTCNFGNLAKGSSATANITVVPQAAGQLSNTVNAAASETDPDTADNSATTLTTVTTPASGPSMLDPNLSVKTLVTGLSQPTMIAFLGAADFLVLEKDTGRVRRVTNGTVQGTALDLAVNSASERGLLGIALHPNFNLNRFVYLYWTESSTGVDTANLAEVPLLGNRVDRYLWNGSTLSFDRNLIKLRAYQADANQPLRGNHNGGVLRFGPDGKLYVMMGDNGRRGFLQNVTSGGPVPDDQYGGPEPDNAHLTGFILRLNDDGSTPVDNPFFNAATNLTGEAAANIKKLFAYGVRNGFGLAFDPLSGNLWDQENGDDAYDEMNRITAGSNNGWVQMMGPMSRVADFKQIESTYGAGNLQQLRWPPSLIADTPQDALSRLYMLPGAHYNEPEFSWRYPTPAAPLGFMQGRGLGTQFEGDMFVGASRTFLAGGFLFRLKLTPDRLHFAFGDARLSDLVADNLDKFDLTESESLLIGKDFGITTDVETGPNGNLFIVSNTAGAVYEISGKQPTVFVANLKGSDETPANNSTATANATLLLSADELTARVSLNSLNGLASAETAAHIHGPGAPGVSAPILFPLPAAGTFTDFEIALTPQDVQNLKAGLLYLNVHSSTFPNGEIRGQFLTSLGAASFQFSSASYIVSEAAGAATISVTRQGIASLPAGTVDYSISGVTINSASPSTDYTPVSGTLHFAPGESLKTFTVPIIDNGYVQGDRFIPLALSNSTGGPLLGSPATATIRIVDNDSAAPTTNPLDDAQFFVNQQYLDFLNRQPDQGGFDYWTNQIAACVGNPACVNPQRINVSAAFFIEAEFQQTGSFVYRLYKGALGRQPLYLEFVADRSKIVGGADLAGNKTALTNEFVLRPEFKQLYPDALNNAQFVNNLFDAAGLMPFAAERQQQIEAMNAGKTRAQVVGDVIEIQAFKDREYNPSFVLMQYFGYLRRDADPAGYAFWLDLLNNRDPNNYHAMVCAFITSAEYQQRFSSIVTHNNNECAGVH
jgi:uncharacterized repeat protein (TIGR01451 family)